MAGSEVGRDTHRTPHARHWLIGDLIELALQRNRSAAQQTQKWRHPIITPPLAFSSFLVLPLTSTPAKATPFRVSSLFVPLALTSPPIPPAPLRTQTMAARHFLCCLPLRLGALLISVAQLLLCGLIAAGSFYTLKGMRTSAINKKPTPLLELTYIGQAVVSPNT